MLTKALASIEPGEDDAAAPHGTFHVVLSAPTLDRDGEILSPQDWKTPLPDHVTFDVDHGMTVETTVGSGIPSIEDDGTLHVRGSYSSLPRAQDVRTLVNEKHIRTTSVAYMSESVSQKDGSTRTIRELLNGAFVSVPSNREALVLDSKAIKAGARHSKGDAAAIQAIHDHTMTLGAQCPADESGAEPGATGGKSATLDPNGTDSAAENSATSAAEQSAADAAEDDAADEIALRAHALRLHGMTA